MKLLDFKQELLTESVGNLQLMQVDLATGFYTVIIDATMFRWAQRDSYSIVFRVHDDRNIPIARAGSLVEFIGAAIWDHLELDESHLPKHMIFAQDFERCNTNYHA